MTKQQQTALNMAKFIQNQSLLLLEKLNELDLDAEADLCEKLHDDAEHLFRTLSSRLDELQDSLFWTTASPYKSGRSDTKIQEGSIGTSCRHLLPGFNSGSVL